MSQTISTHHIAGFTPLNALSRENLKEIAAKTRSEQFIVGETLFHEGHGVPDQWFLAKGVVELVEPDGSTRRIEAGSKGASTSLEGGNPARYTAIARSNVTVYRVDRSLLDMMLTWDQAGSYSVTELDSEEAAAGDDDASAEDWMVRLLQTDAFRRIPPANIQAIFMRMEPRELSAGDEVIRQGDQGEYFYIIQDGRCRVSRKTKTHPDGIRLAELGPGDGFGEEALISDNPRNATVTMVSDGTVMRLSKQDFRELMQEPLQRKIDFNEAQEQIAQGARWLDVRLPPEYEAAHIKGAINLPLVFLRMKAGTLDDVEYIVYCDTGSRSSAAAYLLGERGFNVRILRGGLVNVPEDALQKRDSD